MKHTKHLLLTAAGLMAAPVTVTAEVDVETTNRGSIVSTGVPQLQFVLPDGYNEEYQVWAFGVGAPQRFEVARNYHIFDLSGLTGTVTGAEIKFYHPGENGGNSASYDSPDASETITFFDVDTDSSVFANQSDIAATFADLGTGDIYGTLTADASVNTVDATGTFQTISLNVAAIADIQAAIDGGGDWIIGGALTTFQTDPGTIGSANERVFRGSGSDATPSIGSIPTVLTIEGVVPEPSSLALLGLGGLLVARRRRNI